MNKRRFVVTKEHILLLQKMNIEYNDYCEFGAPTVDPKRPYGNSYVYGDIAKILGISPQDDDEYDPFTDEQMAHMHELHQQTATALQILVANLSLEEGTYEADRYDYNWEKVND